MKLDVMIAVQLGEVVKDEKDYISLMVRELNVPYDKSLTKNKLVDKYKVIIFQRYGKPSKYPALVVTYNNDSNDTVTEFFYKNDLTGIIKETKDKLKLLDTTMTKLSANKPKNSYGSSFM